MNEGPQRAVAHLNAACGQLGLQTAQGQLGFLSQTPPDEVSVRFKNRASPAAELRRRGAARRPVPLRPLHHRRDADIKRRRHRAHRLASLNTNHHPFPQVHRIRLRHACRPPSPAHILNHPTAQKGIQKIRFRLARLRSRRRRALAMARNTRRRAYRGWLSSSGGPPPRRQVERRTERHSLKSPRKGGLPARPAPCWRPRRYACSATPAISFDMSLSRSQRNGRFKAILRRP